MAPPSTARERAPADRLDRAGVPRQRDLDDPRIRALHTELDADQRTFLARLGDRAFDEYRWPRDAVNWWSRRWEYPYCLHHVRAAAPRRALDIGPGLVSFPFFLAARGIDVSACDADLVVVREFGRAADTLGLASKARCVAGRLDALPFPDASFDLAYSISVVEHIPFDPHLFDDLARVVRRGGRLILTMDIALEGRHGVTADRARAYVAAIERSFVPVFPVDLSIPDDRLEWDSARRGLPVRDAWRRVRRSLGLKQYSRMTVVGAVFERR